MTNLFKGCFSDLWGFHVLDRLHLGNLLQNIVDFWVLILHFGELFDDGVVSAQEELEIILKVFMLEFEVIQSVGLLLKDLIAFLKVYLFILDLLKPIAKILVDGCKVGFSQNRLAFIHDDGLIT